MILVLTRDSTLTKKKKLMNKNTSMYSFISQCLDSVREKQGCEWLLPAVDRAWAIAKVVKIRILRWIVGGRWDRES